MVLLCNVLQLTAWSAIWQGRRLLHQPCFTTRWQAARSAGLSSWPILNAPEPDVPQLHAAAEARLWHHSRRDLGRRRVRQVLQHALARAHRLRVSYAEAEALLMGQAADSCGYPVH